LAKYKVLRIINRLNLGGPTYNVTFLTRFISEDYETVLIAGMKDASEASSTFILDQYGVNATLIPDMHRSIHPVKDWKAFWHIYKIIKKEKPDIVHTHAAKAGFLGRLVASYCKVPVIIHTYHGHVFNGYFGALKTKVFLFLERYLAKKSSKLIALSYQQKEELVNTYKICPSEKMEILNLGFDLDKYQEDYTRKRVSFRNKFLIEEDEIAIGIIGRLVPIKNHRLFFDALEIVLNKTQKKVKAIIVGDGELKKELIEYVRGKGLDFVDALKETKKATITFASWQQEIDWVNAGLDIVALSSNNEGTPVSLIEAQASGNPIISTNVGGIKDIVKVNETALLSAVGAAEPFAQNMLKLIEDKALRAQMKDKGRHVFRQFSYKRLCQDMELLYFKELHKLNEN